MNTFIKRDGEWMVTGSREDLVDESHWTRARQGDVTVTKRDGTTKIVRLGGVLRTDGDTALVTVDSGVSAPRRPCRGMYHTPNEAFCVECHDNS